MKKAQSYITQLAKQRELSHIISKFKNDYTYSDGLKISLDIIDANRNAPTVVFIPGTAVYALCYAEIMAKVSEAGFNVIGLDPRGHGRSEGERGDYTFEEVVRDTQSVITYAIENYTGEVSLMGARQGGIVALHVAAADDRVKSAICYNLADMSDPLSKELKIFPRKGTRFFQPILFGLSDVFPNLSFRVNRYLKFANKKVRHFGDTKEFIKQDPLVLKRIKVKSLKSFAEARLAREIDEISTPVFVLQPGEDEIFPVEYTKKIYDKLKCKKRLEIFEGLNYTMMVENVKELSPSILSWLTDIHPNTAQS